VDSAIVRFMRGLSTGNVIAALPLCKDCVKTRAGRGEAACTRRRKLRPVVELRERRLVIADVHGRRRLDLGERRAAVGADADGDAVPDPQVGGGDHRRHPPLPEQEDRLRAEGERLARVLAEQEPQRAAVAAAHVDRDRARAGRRGELAPEEEERLRRRVRLCAAIRDHPCAAGLDLGELRRPRRADVDDDPVAHGEIARVHDRRNPMRPLEELGPVADREALVDARAEHLLQREAVAALDGERERRRAGGLEVAAELEVRRLRLRRAGREGGARAEQAEQQRCDRDSERSLACHLSVLRHGHWTMQLHPPRRRSDSDEACVRAA
jgi:hypothetical protein